MVGAGGGIVTADEEVRYAPIRMVKLRKESHRSYLTIAVSKLRFSETNRAIRGKLALKGGYAVVVGQSSAECREEPPRRDSDSQHGHGDEQGRHNGHGQGRHNGDFSTQSHAGIYRSRAR